VSSAPLESPAEPRRLRADAERNHRKLLDAASEVFAERGLDASVAEIARRAGVGQGTAFRHFPTKEHLIAAVTLDAMDGLLATAVALQAEEDAVEALRTFLRAGAEMQSCSRGLKEAVANAGVLDDEVVAGCHDQLLDTAGVLLARAQAQGGIRDDIRAEDIPSVITAISYAAAPLGAPRPDLWERYFDIVFDGLRAGAAHPLAVPPPTRGDLEHFEPVPVPAAAPAPASAPGER